MSDDLNLSGMSDRDILILLAKTVPGRLNDHGKRLRALEAWRWALAGSGAVLAAVVAALKLNLNLKQSP